MRVLVLLAVVIAAAGAVPGQRNSRELIRPKQSRVPALPAPALDLKSPVGPAEADSQIGIENGKDAEVGQFPWMANILMDDTWVCGGALISDKLILTAAQCASGYARFLVSLGDVTTGGDSPYFIYAYTYKSCWHDDYKEEIHENDIGIIELLYPVKFTDGVQVVKLPLASQASDSFTGVQATVSGFGISETGFAANELKYAEQPVIDNGLCARYLGKYVKSTHICGDGEGGVGTCNGDAGDPLVIQDTDDKTWTLVGISSFQSEVDCGLGYPSAYTRVTAYLDWIQARIDGTAVCYA